MRHARLQIVASVDNRRAQSVLISGATGPNAGIFNGIFDPTSEVCDHRIRYCKRGQSSIWIDHCPATESDNFDPGIPCIYRWNTAYWQVMMTADKGANGALSCAVGGGDDDKGTGIALFRVRGGRALEACKSLQWFENVKSSNQTMRGFFHSEVRDCKWAHICGINLVLQKDAEEQAPASHPHPVAVTVAFHLPSVLLSSLSLTQPCGHPGASGSVFKIEYQGKPAAAKEFHKHMRGMLSRELKSLQLLAHPNIVRVMAVITDAAAQPVGFIMEYAMSLFLQ
jgi:hypothetical protein